MKINSDDALFRIGEVTVLMSCLVAGVLLSASVALGTDAEANKPVLETELESCLLYTSPSPRDGLLSRMPSSA